VRVLVVEDHAGLARNIGRALRDSAAYAVDISSDGQDGLFMAQTNPYDLIVLETVGVGQSEIEIAAVADPTMPAEMPPLWGVYFVVADTDASVAKAQELGGTVVVPPTDIEPGRFAAVSDPGGAMFNVLALKD